MKEFLQQWIENKINDFIPKKSIVLAYVKYWILNKIQPVHFKGDQPWDFFGRTGAKAETSVLWPPHAKSWLLVKYSYAGRDWGQEEKGMTEDGMAGWHHWLDGHEFEWTPGVGDGQGGLMGSQRVGHDWATDLIWSDLMFYLATFKLFFSEIQIWY